MSSSDVPFLDVRSSILLGTLVLGLYIGWRLLGDVRALRTIPCPPGGIPLLGVRLGLPPKSHEVMRGYARQYGELFRLRIGWYNWVFINSPEAFKEILDKQSALTSSKIPAPIGHDLVTKNLRIFTMSHGPKWRSHRTIMHQLLAPKMTDSFTPIQELEAKHMLFQLAFENQNQSEFFAHVRRMSQSVIMTTTYGRRIDSTDHPDLRSADEAAQLLGKITKPGAFIEDDLPFLAWLPHWLQPSRRSAHQYADVVLKGKMTYWNRLKAEISAGIDRPSLAQSIMQSDYQDQGLTEEDGAWIAGGLVEAGAEITAVVIQNLVLYLAATPEAQDRAYEELTKVVGDRIPTAADLPNLPYIRACAKEILRICPVPTWAIKHFTDGEIVYKNHRIPKGTVVVANTSALHYDESRYPEPHVFRPERYLDFPLSSFQYSTMRDAKDRDHFTFGAGRRICPAQRIAEQMLQITAASILWAFRLLPPVTADNETVPIDISEKAFSPTAFRAPKPFKLRFEPRTNKTAETIRREWNLQESK